MWREIEVVRGYVRLRCAFEGGVEREWFLFVYWVRWFEGSVNCGF